MQNPPLQPLPNLHTDPTPNTNPGSLLNEHLIKVEAVDLCAGELNWPAMVPVEGKDPIPGNELSSTVLSAPTDSPFQPGTKVYDRTNYRRAGVAREYGLAISEELVVRPTNLIAVEAAIVGLSVLTVYQALFEETGLAFAQGSAQGKTVVVTAASGAAGQWMVQLAHYVRATVIATTGPDNLDYVRSLGADVVVNYRASSLKEWSASTGTTADIVIDCRGGVALVDAWYAVREGGLLLSIAGQPAQEKPAGLAREAKNYWWVVHPDGSNLANITTLIKTGAVRHSLDNVYGIAHFEGAFRRTDNGHARGKVVNDLSL